MQPISILAGGSLGQSSPIRDQAFKIAEIGFLQILPIAQKLRPRLAFATVGFPGELEVRLHAVYARYGITGFGIPDQGLPEAALAAVPARLEALATVPLSELFVFLSFGCGTSTLRMLDLVEAGTVRPGVLHCADKDALPGWPALRARLEASGYACIGDLEGAELFIDSHLLATAESRPQIASFDVFDTLIARRCVDPWRVFEAVGQKAGIADFVDQRRAAEHRVLEGNYRFDDIYDELARYYGWDEARRREVQALELACEHDTVIPITENLVKVADGDLLISDMYLSEADICGLLARAGLTANVGLHVESHGKASGRIWPEVEQRFAISRHLGDNSRADIDMPGRFGIATELTEASALNVVEQTLLDTGLRNLALLCRECRLATWHPDPVIRRLQVVQTSLNLPLLILASTQLARRAKENGCTSIHFCSRDGNLWLPLFDALQQRMGQCFETRYFLTSRVARKNGSDAYLAYARPFLRRDAMVADLCGTGWSMAHLGDRLGLDACHLFLIDHCPPRDVYEKAKPTPATCTIHKMFVERPDANNIVLELANLAEHGMVEDMTTFGATYVPRLAPALLSEAEKLAAAEQRKCFLSSLALIRHHDLADVFELDDASISFLASALYGYLSRQGDAFELFARHFFKEEEAIVGRLVGG